jgi:3-deoxy-D-manno-octulosonic-acid transferase
MARLAYRLLLLLMVPGLVVRLLWRGRRQPEYLQNLGERFGRYATKPDRPVLWLHAVSVGESRAAAPLIKALAERHPDHAIVMTCMTPTGRATALDLYGSFATVAYLPYDFAFAQRRFLRHFAPRLGVLLETELWPNLLFEARAARVPLALVNARLSERSAAGYARFGALARPALSALGVVAAQTAADAARLEEVGAPRPVVCGNLKFEVEPAPDKLALGAAWKSGIGPRQVWLAASTREGEEAIVLDALGKLREAGQEVLLVLVPRHPQRFDEIAALVQARGLALARRSAVGSPADTQVWLGDSMGEMAAYYALADLCTIGGSLLPYGSQNLIESCACGCPVLVGPSDFNFRQAAQDAIAAGAAARIDAGTSEAVAAAVGTLLAAPERLAAMRQACGEFANAHKGATARTLAVIERSIA